MPLWNHVVVFVMIIIQQLVACREGHAVSTLMGKDSDAQTQRMMSTVALKREPDTVKQENFLARTQVGCGRTRAAATQTGQGETGD